MAYTVRPGDTYWALSKDYCIPVLQLQRANNDTALRANATITIPALVIPAGSLVITLPESITLADYIKDFEMRKSPLPARVLYEESIRRGIDPRFPYAIFRQECSLGTNESWMSSGTNNPANVRGNGSLGKTTAGFAR